MEWLWIVLAGILGIAIGALVVWLLLRGRDDRETVARLQREMEQYRSEVTEHFVHTADLVNNLTSSYKAVYDHLEQGAYRLVDEQTLRERIAKVEAAPVRLEYIGKRDPRVVLGQAALPAASAQGAAAPSRAAPGSEETDTWGAAEGGPTPSWARQARDEEEAEATANQPEATSHAETAGPAACDARVAAAEAAAGVAPETAAEGDLPGDLTGDDTRGGEALDGQEVDSPAASGAPSGFTAGETSGAPHREPVAGANGDEGAGRGLGAGFSDVVPVPGADSGDPEAVTETAAEQDRALADVDDLLAEREAAGKSR